MEIKAMFWFMLLTIYKDFRGPSGDQLPFSKIMTQKFKQNLRIKTTERRRKWNIFHYSMHRI